MVAAWASWAEGNAKRVDVSNSACSLRADALKTARFEPNCCEALSLAGESGEYAGEYIYFILFRGVFRDATTDYL